MELKQPAFFKTLIRSEIGFHVPAHWIALYRRLYVLRLWYIQHLQLYNPHEGLHEYCRA